MEQLNEQQIWATFKSGSDAALTYIYETYAQQLYNYGMQMTPKSEVVRDAIHDLFCDLIQSRNRLGHTTSIKFYLFASLRNRLVRTLKYKESDMLLGTFGDKMDFEIALTSDLCVFEDPFAADVNGILQDALNRLPEKQREAIILYFYENMSYHQISEIMQMTKVKSARALIYRALDSLTALLGKADYLCAIVFLVFLF